MDTHSFQAHQLEAPDASPPRHDFAESLTHAGRRAPPSPYSEREVRELLLAHAQGVVEELLATPRTAPLRLGLPWYLRGGAEPSAKPRISWPESATEGLASRLVFQAGLSRPAALWAVRTWADILRRTANAESRAPALPESLRGAIRQAHARARSVVLKHGIPDALLRALAWPAVGCRVCLGLVLLVVLLVGGVLTSLQVDVKPWLDVLFLFAVLTWSLLGIVWAVWPLKKRLAELARYSGVRPSRPPHAPRSSWRNPSSR